jgi:NSS family neurotransmitter:Na+ symporter
MNNRREHWSSKLGFIMAAAGSAIGLGNIWRFSYVVGNNGGAAFVFIYILIALLIGYPMIITEITMGRESQKNAIGTFRTLAPKTPWWIVGALGVIAGFVILSFYSVVAGWSLAYLFKSVFGSLPEGTDFAGVFNLHITSTYSPLIWHGVFMFLTLGIISAGVVKGIDRTTKILMPLFFVMLVILAVRSLTLPGASAGIAFYLKPDFSELTARSILCALGQVFFTLSLGMGCMITYGSYLGKKDNVVTSGAWVVGLDLAVALVAGLAIFPAVFALGFDPAAGPGLAFITLPAVFSKMPGGIIFATIFFFLLFVAAITSAISLLEVVVAWLVDEHKWNRKKASLLMGFIIFLIGIPASLSLGAKSINFAGISFFNFLDFMQESILLPLGGILTAVFAGYVWTAKRTRELANKNTNKLKIGRWFDLVIKYVVPMAVAIVMIIGLIDRF